MHVFTHIGCHLLRSISIKEKLGLFVGFDLECKNKMTLRRMSSHLRTKSCLLAQPSSKAGSSIPFNRSMAAIIASGVSNSAKPKPWGLLAGVIMRLNVFSCPQACRKVTYGRHSPAMELTASNSLRKASEIPPDIDPTKRLC
jgi:hypothetical protein